jgi:hypothetical protein
LARPHRRSCPREPVLACTSFPPCGSRSSARAPRRSATRLLLSGCQFGDGGLEHLARSGAFPGLTYLGLAATGITDAGAAAFAAHAVNLDQVEQIFLGGVGGGVSDDGIAALARSPHLPALRLISRTETVRNTFDYPADDVTRIERADGSVVESITSYDLA